MSDEELKQVVREFRAIVSGELESVHRRIDEMETGIMNEIRSLGRRVQRLEVQ